MTQEGTARFTGNLHVEMMEDGRLMRLLTEFGYIDPAGETWPVPQGTVTDGASIPRPLWAIVGGPFEGGYRKAAVIHDYYCDVRTRPWPTVHRMFYDAMLSANVGARQAQILYYGVRLGGPRWNAQTIANANLPKPRGLPPAFGSGGEEMAADAVAPERNQVYADAFAAQLTSDIERFAQSDAVERSPEEIEARADAAHADLAERAYAETRERLR